MVLGIHSYHLRRASSVFVDMLNLPVHGAAGEGRSRNHPIVLDIQPRQFENLLWFLYDSPYEWWVTLLDYITLPASRRFTES